MSITTQATASVPVVASSKGNAITLTLPYPVSANRYWASRVIRMKATGRWTAMTYVTPEAEAYKAEVVKIARAAGVAQLIEGRVLLDLQLYPHRPQDWKTRMRKLGSAWDDTVQCIDLGNAEKVISDALQGVVIGDDKWIWEQTKRRMEPDGEGRVVVTITPIAVVDPQLELVA